MLHGQDTLKKIRNHISFDYGKLEVYHMSCPDVAESFDIVRSRVPFEKNMTMNMNNDRSHFNPNVFFINLLNSNNIFV